MMAAMNIAASTRRKSRSPSTKSSSSTLWMRTCLLVSLTICVWIIRKHIRLSDYEYERVQMRPPNPLLCVDDDSFQPANCTCHDVTEAIPSLSRWHAWHAHHDRMVAAAQAAASDVDVLFLGDSITERWNGTRSMGTRGPFQKQRSVFERYFERSKHPESASFQGLALGTSGDTTNHMLWHLEHGLLDNKDLNPHVVVLLIGTNNMGRDGCSKRTTLGGMLHVLQKVHEALPRAKILAHGLLPRGDNPLFFGTIKGDDKYKLGHMWSYIQWINVEFEKFCKCDRLAPIWIHPDFS